MDNIMLIFQVILSTVCCASLISCPLFCSDRQTIDLFKSEFFTSPENQKEMRFAARVAPIEFQKLCKQLHAIENHFQSVRCRLDEKPTGLPLIPKIIHFIWLGPKPLPEKYLDNIQSWHTHNPTYRILVWSDRQKELPDYVEAHLIQELSLQCAKEFSEASNWGEKADLIRYELLNQIGGIYSDTDVVCHTSFDPFVYNFEFCIGMEDFWPLIIDMRLLWVMKAGNCLIGSIPHHPIWKKTLDTIQRNWEEATKKYPIVPEKPRSGFIQTMHRTFLPFACDVVTSYPFGEKDIICPPCYFGLQYHSQKGIYCTHEYDGTWLNNEKKLKEKAPNP